MLINNDSDEDRLENHKVARKRLTPLKTAELRQTSVLEDNGEGGSSLEKKFRPAGALFPKSNKGTFCHPYYC